ncbi:MAG: hypothetical protein JWQ29_2142 [Phenylobacterium sp.]|nr:hypothetical protein [Phenylobacterium sp.]
MKSLVGALVALVGLAGCGGQAPAAKAGGDVRAQDGAYLAPPTPDAVRLTPAGLRLSGSAPAGGRVRLATPAGQALFALVNGAGRWTIVLGPLAEARIFGLSVTARGRSAQAEGYVVVTPQGQAALLRAGAGARRIDTTGGYGVKAIDFDRGGGVEVSATAPPGGATRLHLDGRLAAQGQADAEGHYDASLPTPGSSTAIRPGAHQVQVSGDGFSHTVAFQVSPPAPLAQGPARSQLTQAGLRVDWMTPGGGVQSTILVN